MTTLKKSSYWLSVATLGIILGLSIQFAKAWTEPTAIAPNGNVGAPINTGDNSQYKAGALGIGKVLHGYSNAVFDGNVGIGTTSPRAKLDVQNSVLVQYSSPVYGVAIRSSNGGGWSRAYHFMKRDDNSILGGFGGYGGANSLTYLWAGPNYSSPYMVWESGTGNVGIGTRDPSNAKLRVNGDLWVNRICDYAGANCKSVASLSTTSGGSNLYITDPACTLSGEDRFVGGDFDIYYRYNSYSTNTVSSDRNCTATRTGFGNNWYVPCGQIRCHISGDSTATFRWPGVFFPGCVQSSTPLVCTNRSV